MLAEGQRAQGVRLGWAAPVGACVETLALNLWRLSDADAVVAGHGHS